MTLAAVPRKGKRLAAGCLTVDPDVAVGLALGGYVLAMGILAAALYFIGQTQSLGGRRIPTPVVVVLILLGPIGLAVGLVLLLFRVQTRDAPPRRPS